MPRDTAALPRRLPLQLAVPETTLWFNLEVSARRYPGKAAYVFFGRTLSYLDLYHQAEALAGWLQAQGVGFGSIYGMGGIVAIVLYLASVPMLAFALGMYLPISINLGTHTSQGLVKLTAADTADNLSIGALRDRGTTVFLNSHLLTEVERVCDRVVVIDKGHVKFTGSLDQLTGGGTSLHISVGRVDDDLRPALAEFGGVTVAAGGDVQVTLGPPWDDVPDEAAEQVAAAITRGPWGLRGLVVSRSSLEDAFVAMVSGGDR